MFISIRLKIGVGVTRGLHQRSLSLAISALPKPLKVTSTVSTFIIYVSKYNIHHVKSQYYNCRTSYVGNYFYFPIRREGLLCFSGCSGPVGRVSDS